MSGGSFPEGLGTLRVTHHSMSQPSTASWKLASSSRRLLGHVSHRTRWPVPLMSKGSEDACTSSGIATFLPAAFHGTASPESSAARAHRWPALPRSRRGRQSGVTAAPMQTPAAQFIGVCSSAKTYEMDENLLSMSDPISRPQERLIHAGACIRPPPLQRRPVSSLHPYAAMERSPTAMPPLSEPRRGSVGQIPLPPRLQTLLVPRLQAHLQ